MAIARYHGPVFAIVPDAAPRARRNPDSMPITATAVLRQNQLMRGLADDTLARIAAVAVRRTVPRGAVVFRQGDPGDALYAVVAGRIRIGAQHADGREVFLSVMGPGDSFGEIAAIDGQTRTATATALEPSTLLLVHRGDLRALIARDPNLAQHLLGVFCQRIRWTSDLVEESAFLELPARLASRLLRLAAGHGRTGADGTALHLSQADLAAFLGASRQVVNQHLQSWRARGWIALARGVVVLRDRAALHALARGAPPAAES